MNEATERAFNARLESKVDILIDVVRSLCNQSGTRITRQQLADRLKVHRNTLANMLARDRRMPRPGSDGKWLLADIIAWECEQQGR